MGFFNKSKNKSEASTLPSLPEIPLKDIYEKGEIASESRTFSPKKFSLPAFPDSRLGQKINQETIKDAIQNPEERLPALPYTPKLPEPIQKPMTRELDESDGMLPSMSNAEHKVTFEAMERREFAGKSEPLFIKLEKYEHVLSSFNEIKLRISEIESLLRNIREIKIKEEKELSDWEKEIETIKSRLEQIDREIFKGI